MKKGDRVKVMTQKGINALHFGQVHEVVGASLQNGRGGPDMFYVQGLGTTILVEAKDLWPVGSTAGFCE